MLQNRVTNEHKKKAKQTKNVHTYRNIPTMIFVELSISSLSVRNGDVELTVAVQVYSPESLVSTELIVAVPGVGCSSHPCSNRGGGSELCPRWSIPHCVHSHCNVHCFTQLNGAGQGERGASENGTFRRGSYSHSSRRGN